jgi:hypothetical protein
LVNILDFMNALLGSILNPRAEASAAPPPREEVGVPSGFPRSFYGYKRLLEAKRLFDCFSL